MPDDPRPVPVVTLPTVVLEHARTGQPIVVDLRDYLAARDARYADWRLLGPGGMGGVCRRGAAGGRPPSEPGPAAGAAGPFFLLRRRSRGPSDRSRHAGRPETRAGRDAADGGAGARPHRAADRRRPARLLGGPRRPLRRLAPARPGRD